MYGLQGAAKILYDMVSSNFETYGLKKIESPLCVFHKKGMVINCYVDTLSIFSKEENEIRKLKKTCKIIL